MAYIKIDWDWLRCHWGGLSSPAKAVLPVLLSYKPDTNGHCWPSHETIGKIAGVSVATVKRGIRELEHGGWLTTVRRAYRPSRYVIHPDVRCTPQAERIPIYGRYKR